MAKSPDVPVSRIWLESLSTGELIKLADRFGIDIPFDLERIFIIEELLEYSQTITREVENDLKVDPSCPETAALPKQYNISYIDVIIRDPLWIFVFWEIKGQDRELHENADDFKYYCLRVIPLSEDETELREDSFTLPIEKEDNARYLGFAESSSQSSGRCIIKLGVICGDSEIQIAASQPFIFPRLIDNEDINKMKENPLIRLSAAADLLTIKSADRQSRSKRQ